jgi:hypothetical protein
MASKKSIEVYEILLKKGFPDEFCTEVAYKYMNTDFTANRMLGYLYRITQPSVQEVVDEMFAIISDRDRIVEKHKSEHAQASINDVYRNGL